MDFRKRFLGPEISVRPVSASRPQFTKKPFESKQRTDGRSNAQLRPFFVKTGAIKNAAGSCFLEHANSKIICAVYGPRQASSSSSSSSACGNISCDFKFAPFSAVSKRRTYHKDEQEREWAGIIANTLQTIVLLDKLPNSCIDVHICVLEGEKECILADALNAAIVAVISANIEVVDVAGCCQVGVAFDAEKQPVFLVDPSEDEESLVCDTLLTAVYSPSHNEFAQFVMQGTASSAGLSSECLQEALQWSVEASCKIAELSKKALSRK